MSDELTGIGSVKETGNPAGSTGAEGQGSPSNAAATETQGPAATEAPGNLDWAKGKGWVNEDGSVKADEALKAYQALEKKLGGMVSIPDDKAKPEDVDAFHKRLGWPGDPKGYELKQPEGLPADFVYDESMAEWFRETANELRLPNAAAQGLHDRFIAKSAEIQKGAIETAAADFEAGLTAKAKAAHEALVKDWGDAKSSGYLQNRDAMVRALRADPAMAGLEQELREAGFVTREGHLTSPLLAKLLASHGRQLQGDSLVTGNSGGASNPFAKEAENLTEQTLLIKSDPATARRLASAAGWSAEKINAAIRK